MRKTRKLYLGKLTNEQWLEYLREIKALIEEYGPSALGLAVIFSVFCALYDKACIAIKAIRESIFTPLIAKADKIRDYDYNQFQKKIKDALRHYDDNIRFAAEKLHIVSKRYGNVAAEEYNDESASIMLFVKEVRDNFMDEVNILELGTLLNTLEQHNDEFRVLMNQREQEYYLKTQLKMTVPELRKAGGDCYHDMTDITDAMNIINNTPTVTEFLDKIDLKIEHYSQIIAKKDGVNKAKKAKKDGETEETGETVNND